MTEYVPITEEERERARVELARIRRRFSGEPEPTTEPVDEPEEGSDE